MVHALRVLVKSEFNVAVLLFSKYQSVSNSYLHHCVLQSRALLLVMCDYLNTICWYTVDNNKSRGGRIRTCDHGSSNVIHAITQNLKKLFNLIFVFYNLLKSVLPDADISARPKTLIIQLVGAPQHFFFGSIVLAVPLPHEFF